MSRFKPHIALLICNIVWAMDYPFYNIVLPHYVHPMAMVAGSLVVTALFSLVPLLWQKAERVARADIRKLIGAALLIGVLRKVFIMYGLSMTSPIDGSIIDTIVPLLVLLACALALFLVYLLAQRLSLRKAGFYGTVVAVLLCMLTTWFALGERREMLDDTSAVVMTASTAVKSSPDKSSTDLFVLHEGTVVTITNRLDDWCEVVIADGKKGWLECRKIETI